MEQKEIFRKLAEASKNLIDCPYDSILSIINSMILTDILAFLIPSGTMILRARPNTDKPFTTVEQVSHPQKTDKFGRANRPRSPMFYGAITSSTKENYLDMLVTLFAEILEIFRLKLNSQGEKSMTIGRWFNREDLLVIGMVFNNSFLKKKPNFLGLYNNYLQYLKKYKQNKMQIEILKLISNEFAKSVISDDNEYKISAAFVEAILKKSTMYKLDGIVYPSVRCEGEYLNIALTPDCVKEKMFLSNVVTTTAYFKDGFVINDYEERASLIEGQTEFNLSKISDPNLHLGKEKTIELLEYNIKHSRQLSI